MAKQFLDSAYGLDGVSKTLEFYDEWAASYEAEVTANGYVTPGRCADALAAHVADRGIRILDFGCGTGLSGLALARSGFTAIDGTDLSPGMLAKAQAHGVYARTWLGSVDNPLDFAPGTYGVIAAIGVIGSGAAPVETFDGIMNALKPGGYFLFSYNDHTLEDPAFESRVNHYVDSGGARILFREYGPHLPKRKMNSVVYLLQKA